MKIKLEQIRDYVNNGSLDTAAWNSFSRFVTILMFNEICGKCDDPSRMCEFLLSKWKDGLNSDVKNVEEAIAEESGGIEDDADVKECVEHYKAGLQDGVVLVESTVREVVRLSNKNIE